MGDERLADVLEELPYEDQVDILEHLDSERAADALEEMSADDAADLIADLSPETAATLLSLMEPDEAEDVRRLYALRRLHGRRHDDARARHPLPRCHRCRRAGPTVRNPELTSVAGGARLRRP